MDNGARTAAHDHAIAPVPLVVNDTSIVCKFAAHGDQDVAVDIDLRWMMEWSQAGLVGWCMPVLSYTFIYHQRDHRL